MSAPAPAPAPAPTSPRPPIGAVLITALLVAAVLFLRPLLESLSGIGGGYPGFFPPYLGQLLALRVPLALGVAVPVGLTVLVSFAAVAPLRGSLRMAQVVRRGFATAVVALAAAAIATNAVGLLVEVASFGTRIPSVTLRELAGAFGRQGLAQAIEGLAGNLDVLLAVPLAALLLWGWARSRLAEAAPATPAPRIPPAV
jgi:hypothetical protein